MSEHSVEPLLVFKQAGVADQLVLSSTRQGVDVPTLLTLIKELSKWFHIHRLKKLGVLPVRSMFIKRTAHSPRPAHQGYCKICAPLPNSTVLSGHFDQLCGSIKSIWSYLVTLCCDRSIAAMPFGCNPKLPGFSCQYYF